MKLSLRNLALASTIAVAGAAFAQDAVTPTVTKVWSNSFSGTSKNDTRFGTGVNGKIYYNDKAAGKVMVIDADGQKEYATVAGLGTGISADDAGNLLVNTGFSNNNSASDVVLIKTDGTQTPAVLNYPKEVVPARVDQIGRIVGDMYSEEGSFFYIGSNGATCVAMFQFAEGVQVTPLEYYSSEALNAPALNTSTIVQPEYTFEELADMGDDAINGFAIRNRSTKSIYYFNPEGEFVAMPAPAGANTQEGFDVFVLGDVMYQVMPIKGASGENYSCEFVIADENGNIIFTEEVKDAGDGSQNFGSFAARKVSDNKVELYMYYSSAKGIQAAMYEITLPEPTIELPTVYLAGDFQGWSPENAAEMTATAGVYEYTFAPSTGGAFKMSTAKGSWDEFNAAAFGAAEDNQSYTLPIDEIVKVEAGKIGNLAFPGKGTWTLVFDYAKMEVVLKGEADPLPPVTLPDFYLRGDLNNWGTGDAYKMVYTGDAAAPVANENGEYTFTITLDKLSGAFKFASEDWNTFNYGAKGEDPVVENGKTLESWTGSSENFLMGDLVLENVTVNFYYQPDGSKPSYVKVEGTEPPVAKTTDRGQFAYGLDQVKGENNVFTITFKATGDADRAVLVLTDENGDETSVDLDGNVVAGENTKTADLSDLKPGSKYNWAIEIHNYEIPEDIITETQNIGGSRGGVVCMTDPEYDSYGMTVIGRTKNGGFDIYNQLGEKVQSAIHANNAAMGGTAANNSCPMRARQRNNTAQFASWGDAACGVVALDFDDLTKEPFCVFEGTNTGNGTIMNGDVAVGSGTPCLAYAGEGEGTILFTFDEDIFGNNLAANPIGTAPTTGKAAENWGFNSAMANTNVGLLGTKNGLFFSQTRANGMESAVRGIGYISLEEKDIIWSSDLEAEQYPEFLKSATGGIDINPAGDLFAISTYTGINLYLLSWDGEMPVLEPYKVIDVPYQSGVYTTVRFDAGGNLHVINQTQGYYQVIPAEKEPIATTPAKKANVIEITSGVENVTVAEQDAAAVYYNLNGVRVDADTLTPGVYVKVVGKVATKVVVK